MSTRHSILVGVDFTPWSAVAVGQALRMAGWENSAMHVVHVIDVSAVAELEVGLAELGETPEGIRDCFVRDARAEWEQFRAAVPGASGLDVEVVIGSPPEVVLRRARRYSADLIVLGVQGGGAPVGAVAAACLRGATQDVLLVRRQQFGKSKVVVACVDFSDAPAEAMAEAAELAARDGAALHALHVYHGPWHPLQYWPRTSGMGGNYPRRYRESMLRRLERVCRSAPQTGGGVRPQLHVMDHASNAAGIAEFAADVGADLIVLGRRHHWSVEVALLGSMAERVARQAGCSVLAVRPNAGSEPAAGVGAVNVQALNEKGASLCT
jgi:nucleotide-binding universal stress UspA family protein